ncbi:MAG: DUF3332 domain-containing protein [Odoribacter sp.]
MKKTMIKMTAILLIAGSSVSMMGCFGPFALTTKIHAWNSQVSQSKFVNELVFLGLCILPVYELCVFGDALIFNSIEFWGGSNPIAMKDGQVEEMDLQHEGQMYQVIKSKNAMSIAQTNSDLRVDFKYFPKEKTWYLMNGENKVKVVDMKGDKVYTYLPNDKTLVFDHNTVDLIPSEVMAAK